MTLLYNKLMPLNLKEVPLFSGLSESELSAVSHCLREKSFQKGELLFSEGNSCDRVFVVRSGRVKLYRTASSGREQILETLEPGDTCACNPGTIAWSCSSTAEAVTPCAVWFLSREDYVRMVNSNPKVSHSLNQLLAKRLQCFSSLIEEVSLKDSKKRLVKFLLDMYTEQSKDGPLSIPFTREEIAQRLGTARETVERQLTELKQKSLISIKPRQIILQDIQGLKKLLI